MSKSEAEFQVAIAAMFAFAVAGEYADAVQVIADNYTANKSKEAEKACLAARNALQREITKHMAPEGKQAVLDAIEVHKELIYQFFSLNSEKQHRVRQLIKKIA